jgi:MraZ protein
MYLTGQKDTNVDSKGRIVLPAEMRKFFTTNTVMLVPVQGALCGFTPEGYVAWIEENCPDQKNIKSPDSKRARFLNQNTVAVELDKAGRLAVGRVKEETRRRLGILAEVSVLGNGDHFEIWNAQALASASTEGEDAEDLEALLFG